MLSAKTRWKIYRRDKGICQYCQRSLTGRKFHVDHIVPRCKGGSDGLGNLILSCARCNIAKLTMDADIFKSLLKENGLEWRNELYRENVKKFSSKKGKRKKGRSRPEIGRRYRDYYRRGNDKRNKKLFEDFIRFN